MNVKKSEKTGYRKSGFWNRLHGISFDVHTSSQTNMNRFDDADSLLVEKNTRKREVGTVLAFERCMVEVDRLRFQMT